MARFGMEPGERGGMEEHVAADGSLTGFFVPKDSPEPGSEAAMRLIGGVKVLEIDVAGDVVRMYPTNTFPDRDEFLGPKYDQITTISFAANGVSDLVELLEDLPSGFTKDPEYGLGLAKECGPIISLIEDNTDCTVIELVPAGTPEIDGHTFRLSFARLESLRMELARIKNRGDNGIRSAKKTFVHNDLAESLGLNELALSLGRHPIRSWVTKVAAGTDPLSDAEQEGLLDATAASAAQLAIAKPDRMTRLQRDIEIVNLSQLIASYATALDAGHKEDWWQQFFEENVFALQLLFGGPTVFIDAQVPIGEGGNSMKGKKIADYLLRNAMTNNASLVEIKKPSTKLMKRRPYRKGVYGVQSEIGESVTQVLDQALQLTRHEVDTKSRIGNSSWVSNAPRCFVVAGRLSELDSDDKMKSFDLYREHLAGVRLVTYDEILEQLKTLRGFLTAEGSE